jgi:hypothetical protein
MNVQADRAGQSGYVISQSGVAANARQGCIKQEGKASNMPQQLRAQTHADSQHKIEAAAPDTLLGVCAAPPRIQRTLGPGPRPARPRLIY